MAVSPLLLLGYAWCDVLISINIKGKTVVCWKRTEARWHGFSSSPLSSCFVSSRRTDSVNPQRKWNIRELSMDIKAWNTCIDPLAFFFCFLIFENLLMSVKWYFYNRERCIRGKVEHKKGIKITSINILVYVPTPIHIIYTQLRSNCVWILF